MVEGKMDVPVAGWAPGRVEKFGINEDEELLGCILQCDDWFTIGVTWLKWKRPED